MLVLHAINLGIFAAIFFILGMIKPKWPLFFLEKPNRWHILTTTLVFVMVFMTMYGEGVKQDKLKQKHANPAAASAAPAAPAVDSVPVPVPVEKPEKPAKK